MVDSANKDKIGDWSS